tara:strand:- start:66 stop:551 length:486 start_codon:yes stop_codon:yes gene_type:complete
MSTLRVDSIRGQTADGTNRYVVQVISVENNTYKSTQSTSFVDSGLSATITPSSANNKILILTQNSVKAITTTSNGSGTLSQIFRGSTAIGQQVLTRIREGVGSSAFTQNVQGGGHLQFLDSPNTTSATTYSVKFKVQNAVVTGVYNDSPSGSVITLMEIAQ